MFNTITDFVKLIDAYLDNKSLFTFSLQLKAFNLKDKDRLPFVIDTLKKELKTKSLDFVIQVITAIDEVFITKKSLNNAEVNSRMDQFKKTLAQSKDNNWKNTLLNLHLQVVQNKYYSPIYSMLHAKYPIQSDSKSFIHDDSIQLIAQQSYAVLGSTFVTNREFILQNAAYEADQAKLSHVLDACFAAYTIDDKKDVTGCVLAIGDGAGGHFGEDVQDQAIARASHFATKYSVRLMGAFQDPDTLKKSLHTVIQQISGAVKRKYRRNRDGIAMSQEQTTLAAVRIFNYEDHVRVIEFNVGDSMIMSWHPESKLCQTLLPAHVRIFRNGQEATALIPLSL